MGKIWRSWLTWTLHDLWSTNTQLSGANVPYLNSEIMFIHNLFYYMLHCNIWGVYIWYLISQIWLKLNLLNHSWVREDVHWQWEKTREEKRVCLGQSGAQNRTVQRVHLSAHRGRGDKGLLRIGQSGKKHTRGGVGHMHGCEGTVLNREVVNPVWAGYPTLHCVPSFRKGLSPCSRVEGRLKWSNVA